MPVADTAPAALSIVTVPAAPSNTAKRPPQASLEAPSESVQLLPLPALHTPSPPAMVPSPAVFVPFQN